MITAIFEAIIGVIMLVVFISKFIKIGPMEGISALWQSASLRFKFITRWWFNLFFIVVAVALISAAAVQLRASRLGVDRAEYSAIETDARSYGLTVEQYFEEGKKAKELKFDKTSTYLDAKKFGLLDPVEYGYAMQLGRTLEEWKKDKLEISKSGQPMDHYVSSLIDNMRWIENFEAKLSRASAEDFRIFKNNIMGLADNRLLREQEKERREKEIQRAELSRSAIGKNISNRECKYLGIQQVARESIYCYAAVGFKDSNDASTIAYLIKIDAANDKALGEIYPEDKFKISGVIRKVAFGSEATRFNVLPIEAGDAVIEVDGLVKRAR